MNIISGIGESGFLAHSAFSAGIATKDSNGNDITATYLTGVDLTPYQLTADMTAYQSAGDYLTTADSANFYTTANESGYLTAVPDTYLQNTDLSTEDGKVTAISGIPLSAGGDVPEGVMVESAVEYNAVNEISGYNGSAIAQYGAEKQWLQHDDTIVHVANSAQYAFGCNISALQRLMGIDETVLFESNDADGTTITTASPITLTEDYSNFNRMRIEYRIWSDQSFKYILEEVPCRNGYFTLSHGYINAPINPTCYEFLYGLSGNDSKLYYSYGRFSTMGQTGLTTVNSLNIMGVTGIGRRS